MNYATGEVIEIGTDDKEQPRILIHSTEAELKRGGNLICNRVVVMTEKEHEEQTAEIQRLQSIFTRQRAELSELRELTQLQDNTIRTLRDQIEKGSK